MKKSKTLGQVFTPEYIIEMILDNVGYCGPDIIDKTIMEPSFGDGRFIKKIIDRLIDTCRKAGLSNHETAIRISNNIYGIEIDGDLYKSAVDDIIAYIKGKIGTYIDINLYCEDTLVAYKNYIGTFDFVVGNPPFVRARNANEQAVLKKFAFSKQSVGDLYLAFYDAGIQMLKECTGVLGFISPSSWMFNKAGTAMRNYITGWPILEKIIDFGHKQIFPGFTTYTAITIISKKTTNFSLEYEKDGESTSFAYKYLWLDGRFCFAPFHLLSNYREIHKIQTNCMCRVKNGYATLCDPFFIDNENFPPNEYMIKVCKASTHKTHSCFFPYNEKGEVISLEKIKENKALYDYLTENKTLLQKRDIEPSALWYAFGRSQAIADTHQTQYAINTLVRDAKDISLTPCPPKTGVYGGLYLLTSASIDDVLDILHSDHFQQYLFYVGALKSGGYYTLTSKQLEKYLNYFLLKKTITEGTVLYTDCFGYTDKIIVSSYFVDAYGEGYLGYTEDGCDDMFFLKNIGKTVFLSEEELRHHIPATC